MTVSNYRIIKVNLLKSEVIVKDLLAENVKLPFYSEAGSIVPIAAELSSLGFRYDPPGLF